MRPRERSSGLRKARLFGNRAEPEISSLCVCRSLHIGDSVGVQAVSVDRRNKPAQPSASQVYAYLMLAFPPRVLKISYG